MKSLQGSKPSRTVILDIETESLTPSVIWVAVAKDAETGDVFTFRRPDLNPEALVEFANECRLLVGHNIIGFDYPTLSRLVRGFPKVPVLDTLVVSRLLDFDILGGHSLEAWGHRLGCQKIDFHDYSQLTEEMVEYCIQDVHVTHKLYDRFKRYIDSDRWIPSIALEHFIAGVTHQIHVDGFYLDLDTARELRYSINKEVLQLDANLATAFPPKPKLVREITPRLTKHGTLNRNDFRWVEDGDLSCFNGGPFSLIEYVEFNPGSPVQIVERLNEAGWKPTEKTKGHLQAIREKDQEKLAKFRTSGWTVSEVNLQTLPDTAPEAAKGLAKRIMYASRVRTLDEWIKHTDPVDSRVHGRINHIGAWSGRCSHDKPNTGNIPRDDAVFGKEMRSLWGVDTGYLVGVDAESIQLRVLAHYINDPRFTAALCEGDKEAGTDPHSLNKEALGEVCKSRNVAKTFIYAFLLGAGIGKLADVLECSIPQAKAANERFISFYPGLKLLRERVIPADAARGYFEGFDKRLVKIRGDDVDTRKHYALAGYLQNGEAVVMKTAKSIWIPRLRKENVPFKLVNFVHDEWQTQVPDEATGEYVGDVQMDSIRIAGERLNLRCPMAGSVLSAHGHRAIGKTWYDTH